MVVDADPRDCRRIELVVRSWGHPVVGCAGGAQAALDVIEKQRPRVALVGMDLLDAAGSLLVRQLLAADPALGVVLVLGESSADALHEAMASGARGIMLRSGPVADLASGIVTAAEGEYVATQVNQD
ncbi:MAG: hypothetical protein QOG41_346 [Thermoleophilaceae bacterium]|nr:hypothetical protein [Thermoleophilaceae bacterium]